MGNPHRPGARSDAETSERHRRQLLAEADRLLDQVEHLRLVGLAGVPPRLRAAIRELQVRLGGHQPVRSPDRVGTAQAQLFAIQHRLMAANPGHRRPRSQGTRAAGLPAVARLAGGGRWKLLSLPPPPDTGEPAAVAAWVELVDETVERAADRWAFAQQRVLRAARERRAAGPALVVAAAAWANYWELLSDAERLLEAPAPTVRAGAPLLRVVPAGK